MPTKMQNQTKIFIYKMELKYNKENDHTIIIFYLNRSKAIQFKAIFGKIA